MKLSDNTYRKFVEQIDISDAGWEVESEEGFVSITSLNKTVDYDVYNINLEDSYSLKCADTHILIDEDYQEIYAVDSLNTNIRTKTGSKKVISVENLGYKEAMYDLSVASEPHTYYTNDILSHNTVTVATYLLWRALFGKEENIGIAANKMGLAVEILDKIKNIFMNLPIWLAQGIKVFNKRTVEFENGCRIMTSATNGDSFRGYSLHILYTDEVAFIRSTVWKEFEDSVFPTVEAIEGSQIILTSTPNGLNHFYHIIKNAKENRSGYAYVTMDWWEVPGRDEKWKQGVIAANGLVYFNQNFGCEFLGSSTTLIDSFVLRNLPVKEPIKFKKEGIHGIRVYEEVKPGRNYVFGIDAAKDGLDYFAFNIIDVTTIPFKQVLSANLQMNYLDLALPIFNLATEYNEAFVIIENNEGAGQSLADMLWFTYEYENLYSDPGKKHKGYRTTTRTRKLMLTQLKALIESDNLQIFDKESQEEFFHFLEIKGKFQADEGYHDDLVMSLGICVSFLNDVRSFEDMGKYVEMLQKGKKREHDDNDNPDTDTGKDVYLKDLLKIGAFEAKGDDDYVNPYVQDYFNTGSEFDNDMSGFGSDDSEFQHNRRYMGY